MEVPLIVTIEAFLEETAIPASLLGSVAARDPRLVQDLRLGRRPGTQMCARMEGFMRGYYFAHKRLRDTERRSQEKAQ